MGRASPEGPDDGLRQLGEVAVMHADGFCVSAGVEDHLRISHQAPIHEHPVSVHRAEGGHGADFILGVQRRNLFFMRQAQRGCVGEQAELLEMH